MSTLQEYKEKEIINYNFMERFLLFVFDTFGSIIIISIVFSIIYGSRKKEFDFFETWARSLKTIHPISGEVVSAISLEDMTMIDLNGNNIGLIEYKPDNINKYKLVNSIIFEV